MAATIVLEIYIASFMPSSLSLHLCVSCFYFYTCSSSSKMLLVLPLTASVDGFRVRVNDNGHKDRNRVTDDDRND